MIRIIGIGSPFGDDAAGLEAARMLAAAPPPRSEVVAADRPGAGLIDLFDGADAVILIDAVRSGAPPGTIHDRDLRELGDLRERLVSSHDIGVAAAIALAASLGRPPVRGRLVGIEVSSESRRPGEISPPVRKAIDGAIALVREWSKRLDTRAAAGPRS
jgi:hydrogenase maturation protease